MLRPFVWLALSIAISFSSFGQKKFEVVLSFPGTLSLTDLRIQIDNGLGRTTASYKITDNNQVVLSDFYYSRYAAIVISLPKSANGVHHNFFFVDEKHAKITFLPVVKDSSPLDRYVLTNAYDFRSERDKMEILLAEFAPEFYFMRFYDFHESIDMFAKDRNIDLIIVAPRYHSFYERLFKTQHTNKLIYQSKVPVLAVHE